MAKIKIPQNPVIARFTVQGLPTQVCRYHVTRVGSMFQVSIHMGGRAVNVGKKMSKADAMRTASDACNFGAIKVEEYFKAVP